MTNINATVFVVGTLYFTIIRMNLKCVYLVNLPLNSIQLLLLLLPVKQDYPVSIILLIIVKK